MPTKQMRGWECGLSWMILRKKGELTDKTTLFAATCRLPQTRVTSARLLSSFRSPKALAILDSKALHWMRCISITTVFCLRSPAFLKNQSHLAISITPNVPIDLFLSLSHSVTVPSWQNAHIFPAFSFRKHTLINIESSNVIIGNLPTTKVFKL